MYFLAYSIVDKYYANPNQNEFIFKAKQNQVPVKLCFLKVFQWLIQKFSNNMDFVIFPCHK